MSPIHAFLLPVGTLIHTRTRVMYEATQAYLRLPSKVTVRELHFGMKSEAMTTCHSPRILHRRDGMHGVRIL